jgi:hypothetical protein
MTRLASVLVLAALVAAPGCTLYFDDGDDDDGGDPGDDGGDDGDRPDPDRPPPNPDPDDPGGALLIIGTAPSIERSDGDWATVWLNYPALDCNPVNLYGVTVAVRIDEAFERFVDVSGIEVGQPGGLVAGWLTVRRQSPAHLWRVAAWEPEAGGTQPACYRW